MAMTSSDEESDSESEAGVRRRNESDSEIEKLEQKALLTAQEMARIQQRKSKEAQIEKESRKYQNATTVVRGKDGRKVALD